MLRRLLVAIALVIGGVVAGGSVAHAACAGAAVSYGGGTGTTADPYLLSTPAQLERYLTTTADWASSFRITTDLEMNGCSITVPYATYTGVFDGGYRTVSDLTISGNGFFPVLWGSGVVKNLGLDVTVTHSSTSTASFGTDTTVDTYAGGMVGRAGSSTRIENSWVSGSLTVRIDYTHTGPSDAYLLVGSGGMVGVLEGALVDSWSAMDVVSSAVARSTGVARDATVTHYEGSLVGWSTSSTAGSFANNYVRAGTLFQATSATANGSTYLTAERGVVAGRVNSAVMANIAWDFLGGSAVGTGTTSGTHVKLTDELKDFASFGPAGLAWDITDGWSAATTWSICPRVNSGFPFHSGRYTTNPCVDPPGEPEPAALPWTPRILDVVVRDGSVEVTFELVHMRQTTSWYEVQSLSSGTCRALHESVGATGTCVFDTRRTNAREQFRVIAHNAYGASDPSAWTPTAGVVVGSVAPSTSPAATPPTPVASCSQPASRKVTTGVRDVITIDGATCPVSVSVTARRELGVTVAVPTNGPVATYTLVASRNGGASVRRVWSAPTAGTLRTVIGPVKFGDWTLRLDVRSSDGRVSSWTSPVVRVA